MSENKENFENEDLNNNENSQPETNEISVVDQLTEE